MCWDGKGVIEVKRYAHHGGTHSPTGKYFSGTSRPHSRNLVHGQMRGGIRL